MFGPYENEILFCMYIFERYLILALIWEIDNHGMKTRPFHWIHKWNIGVKSVPNWNLPDCSISVVYEFLKKPGMKSTILVFVVLLIQEAFSNIWISDLLHRMKRQTTYNCQGNTNCGQTFNGPINGAINIGGYDIGTLNNNNHNEFNNGNVFKMSGGTMNGGTFNLGGSNSGSGGSNSNAGRGERSSMFWYHSFLTILTNVCFIFSWLSMVKMGAMGKMCWPLWNWT